MKVQLEMVLNAVAKGDSRYLVASLTDVTERLNLEARLAAVTNEQLGFQRLISDIAAEFATVEPPALDSLIVSSLQQIGEVLQLDRAILWRWRTGDAATVPAHYWVSAPEVGLPDALEIAVHTEVDLHWATSLVERGCPSSTAVRIVI